MMDISNNMEKPIPVRDQQRICAVDQPQVKATRSEKAEPASDEVALSEQAQLLAKLNQAVQDSPDVREDKVAALREAVGKKQYEISYSEIAKAILATRGK